MKPRKRAKRPVVPELKRFDCTDLDPVDEWTPGADAPAVYWLVCHIGAPDSPGADMFTVPVLNVAGLKSDRWRTQRGSIEPVVVEPYSWADVEESVRRRIAECSAPDWLGCQELLRRRFRWEFEGMTEPGG